MLGLSDVTQMSIVQSLTARELPLSVERYMVYCTLFIVITQSSSNIGKIEARENLNHDEYVEEEDYYNVDSDESDIDAN